MVSSPALRLPASVWTAPGTGYAAYNWAMSDRNARAAAHEPLGPSENLRLAMRARVPVVSRAPPHIFLGWLGSLAWKRGA